MLTLLRLLCDRSCRLQQFQQVKSHPVFSAIDWSNLHLLDAPFVPVVSSPDDISNFVFDEEESDASDLDYETDVKANSIPTLKSEKSAIRQMPFIGYTHIIDESAQAPFEVTSTLPPERLHHDLELQLERLKEALALEVKKHGDSRLKMEHGAAKQIKEHNLQVIMLKEETKRSESSSQEQIEALRRKLSVEAEKFLQSSAQCDQLEVELGRVILNNEVAEERARNSENQMDSLGVDLKNALQVNSIQENRIVELDALAAELKKTLTVAELDLSKAHEALSDDRMNFDQIHEEMAGRAVEMSEKYATLEFDFSNQLMEIGLLNKALATANEELKSVQGKNGELTQLQLHQNHSALSGINSSPTTHQILIPHAATADSPTDRRGASPISPSEVPACTLFNDVAHSERRTMKRGTVMEMKARSVSNAASTSSSWRNFTSDGAPDNHESCARKTTQLERENALNSLEIKELTAKLQESVQTLAHLQHSLTEMEKQMKEEGRRRHESDTRCHELTRVRDSQENQITQLKFNLNRLEKAQSEFVLMMEKEERSCAHSTNEIAILTEKITLAQQQNDSLFLQLNESNMALEECRSSLSLFENRHLPPPRSHHSRTELDEMTQKHDEVLMQFQFLLAENLRLKTDHSSDTLKISELVKKLIAIHPLQLQQSASQPQSPSLQEAFRSVLQPSPPNLDSNDKRARQGILSRVKTLEQKLENEITHRTSLERESQTLKTAKLLLEQEIEDLRLSPAPFQVHPLPTGASSNLSIDPPAILRRRESSISIMWTGAKSKGNSLPVTSGMYNLHGWVKIRDPSTHKKNAKISWLKKYASIQNFQFYLFDKEKSASMQNIASEVTLAPLFSLWFALTPSH